MNREKTSKYTIVGFLGDNEPPQYFSENDWPLHVTLLDPFKTEWSEEELIFQTEKLTFMMHSFPLKLSSRSFLGPNKDVPVMLLEIDESISLSHSKLLELGKRGSFVYNTPEFVGDGFAPHITDTADERAELGRSYDLTTISIVNTIPDGDPLRRSIIKTFDILSS